MGSGYLLCLNYTARKSSRSSCAGEGVVIDHASPGDFEIRLMVIVREGRNANEIVVIAADVMQNIKAQSWPKKHFRLNFCLSTILIEVNTMESILFRGGNIGDKQWPVAICAQG